MSKLLRNNQNKAKALELKLEEVSTGNYQLILAGMTIHHRSGCRNGFCEGGVVEDYLYMENETYKVERFSSYAEAETAYAVIKESYID